MDLEGSQAQKFALLQSLLSISDLDLAWVRFLALVLSEESDELLLDLANARLHKLTACDIIPDVVEHRGELKVVDLFTALQSDEQVLLAGR